MGAVREKSNGGWLLWACGFWVLPVQLKVAMEIIYLFFSVYHQNEQVKSKNSSLTSVLKFYQTEKFFVLLEK